VAELVAQLRELHRSSGRWDESFHQIVVEAVGEYVVRCAHSVAPDRVLEHLAYLGERATTHDEIAAAAALSRETVTRALKVLETEGRVIRLAAAPSCWAYRVVREPEELGRERGSRRAPGIETRAPLGPGSPRRETTVAKPLGPVARGGVETAASRDRRG